MKIENPNPSLWRHGRTTISLEHVVATTMGVADGNADKTTFCVLFDRMVGVNHHRAGDITVVETWVPFEFDGATIESFLNALEVYHSKR